MCKPATLLLFLLCGTPMGAATLVLNATANSQLAQGGPDTVWVDWGQVEIQNYIPGAETNVIFRFDLSALPAGATITSATFRLYDTGYDNANTQFLEWHPDSSWNPDAVTWNTFPTASNKLVGTLGATYGWQYNDWAIDLAAWNWSSDLAQNAATFQLRMGYGDYYFNDNQFVSVGAPGNPNHPLLVLEYSGGSAIPEPGTFALLTAGLAAAALLRRRAQMATVLLPDRYR